MSSIPKFSSIPDAVFNATKSAAQIFQLGGKGQFNIHGAGVSIAPNTILTARHVLEDSRVTNPLSGLIATRPGLSGNGTFSPAIQHDLFEYMDLGVLHYDPQSNGWMTNSTSRENVRSLAQRMADINPIPLASRPSRIGDPQYIVSYRSLEPENPKSLTTPLIVPTEVIATAPLKQSFIVANNELEGKLIPGGLGGSAIVNSNGELTGILSKAGFKPSTSNTKAENFGGFFEGVGLPSIQVFLKQLGMR